MGRFFAMFILLLLNGCRSVSSNEVDVTEVLRQVENLNTQGNYTEAISLLKTSDSYIHLDLLEALAFEYEASGQLFLSAQTFEQLFFADVEKKYTESAFYAAQIYAQLGYLYAAGRCYRLYIDIHSKDAQLWFALAEIEETLEQEAFALTAYLNGIQVCSEKTADMLFRLTQLCYKNKMWDESAFWAQEYLKDFENNAEILQILLNISDMHNDRQKVKVYVAELEKINPEFLSQHPDISLKYIEETIAEKEVSEEVFLHKIKSSPEEIKNTLEGFYNSSRWLESLPIKRLKYPTYLCQPCTY